MTAADPTAYEETRPSGVEAEADALVASLLAAPGGQVSPSVYETGRVVALAPWLRGHAARVRYLLAAQRPDGGWGGPEGYALVPTLSAVDALLATVARGELPAEQARLHRAAAQGLRRLRRWLAEYRAADLPDMPAIELIVPALVGSLNRRLRAGLPLPAGMTERPLRMLRSWLASDAEVPEKLLHALEVAGEAAGRARGVRPTPLGTVGASPAATAAWLHGRDGRDGRDAPARHHLEEVAERHGGPVPVGYPITVFERGWTLSWLLRAGVPLDVPARLPAELRAALGPAGAPGGEGLPADADSTSVALYTLLRLGEPVSPDCLAAFDAGTHFCTWQGEQGFSVSVNAHVLDALGEYLRVRPEAGPRHAGTVDRLCRLLRARQRADGGWQDRWHVSPYYATACCVLALADFGGDAYRDVLDRAVRWTLDTQRDDGSWGRWAGTAEETAYALHILIRGTAVRDERCATAIARGYARLRRASREEHPALWHDKDLYLPRAIVEAVILAARHLAEQDSPNIATYATT